ncbi:MAG: hypothetical protein V4631_08715 [Pseudomonadota bacterium]
MNDQELKLLWKSQPLDAETMSLDTIRRAANDFHATIVRRNRQEAFASYLVMLIFGVFAWIQESTTMRIGCILIVLGTPVMLYQLRKRAAISALPSQDMAGTYVAYFRSELIRQRDALRAIWLWYIAPAVPGVAVLVWGMAEMDPSGFPWIPVLAMFIVPFGVAFWMNLAAARRMQQKIDELDASAL